MATTEARLRDELVNINQAEFKANATYDAIGVRIKTLSMKPGVILLSQNKIGPGV